MIGTRWSIGFLLLEFVFAAGSASIANGAQRMTPFGPTDSSCIVDVPKGALFDVESGDVIQNGVRVGHHDKCVTSEPANPQNVPGTVEGTAFAYAVASATTISGLTQFDEMAAYWIVPSDPPPGAAGTTQYLWFGLQNGMTSGPTVGVLQTVLEWGQDGANYWQVASWWVYACVPGPCQYADAAPEAAGVGDYVGGAIIQNGTSPPLWYMQMLDFDTGAESAFDVTINASWPQFNYALNGVFEAASITSCSQLSSANQVAFTLSNLSEGGPYPRSGNNVLPGQPNAPSWGVFFGSTLTPQCSWYEHLLNGGANTTVEWIN